MAYIKAGYIRIISVEGEESYLSYDEATKERMAMYKSDYDVGLIKLYCACSLENHLELTITADHVVRVKRNEQQDLHMESCPKSIRYTAWKSEKEQGVFESDDGMIFRISEPSLYKSTSKSSKKSEDEEDEKEEKEKRERKIAFLEMMKVINANTWLLQTYSKKKEIGLANRANRQQDWKYKSLDEFLKQMYASMGKFRVHVRNQIFFLSDKLYKSKEYEESVDPGCNWIIFSKIVRISEYKKERKYQYVTLALSSDKGNRTPVRIKTELYDRLFQGYEEQEGMHALLAGYITKSTYDDWRIFYSGGILWVSENGLFVENKTEATVINFLAQNRIIFNRPKHALENYRDLKPTVRIERLHGKDILIDVVSSKQEYNIRKEIAEDNPEYDCIVIMENTELSDWTDQLVELGVEFNPV